jgi:hypothetical protein
MTFSASRRTEKLARRLKRLYAESEKQAVMPALGKLMLETTSQPATIGRIKRANRKKYLIFIRLVYTVAKQKGRTYNVRPFNLNDRDFTQSHYDWGYLFFRIWTFEFASPGCGAAF